MDNIEQDILKKLKADFEGMNSFKLRRYFIEKYRPTWEGKNLQEKKRLQSVAFVFISLNAIFNIDTLRIDIIEWLYKNK